MGIQFNGNTDTISTNDGTLNVNPQTTFEGEVGIAGTLTYEDVTNIDSVGIITARSGIRVGVNGTKRETVHFDAGDSGANYLRFTNTTTGNGATDGFNVGINADEEALIWNFETKPTIFATNNEERVRIDSSGNVGVGTNVASDSTGNAQAFTLARTGVNGQLRLILKNEGTGFGNGVGYHQGIDGTNVFIENRTSGGYLDFSTNNSGSHGSRLRIISTGLVGINSATPTEALEVRGNIFARGATSSDKPKIKFGFTNGVIQSGKTEGNVGSDYLAISGNSTRDDLVVGFNGNVGLGTNNPTEKLEIHGHTLPGSDDAYDLGSSTKRFRFIYTTDLQLSNENTGGNEVDGTEGNWTLQEGEDDIYMINRKNGKRYKIKMEEV